MFSLCLPVERKKPKKETKQQNTLKNPFTNLFILFLKSAIFQKILPQTNYTRANAKGISPHLHHSKRIVSAAMTVEASLLLPLFLFFFFNLMSIMEIICLHSKIQLALWNAGHKLQMIAVMAEDGENTVTTKALGMVGTSLVLRSYIVDFLGEEYLQASPLERGKDSLLCFQMPQEQASWDLDLRVEYRVKPMFSVPGFPSFLMNNRYYAHPWCGYDTEREGQQEELYYVTENSQVYHLRTSCSYLNLSVRKVVAKDYFEQAKKEGLAIKVCQRCKRQKDTGWLFVTQEGDCYHKAITCSALKRTIYTISDSSGYRPCGRCAKGGLGEAGE